MAKCTENVHHYDRSLCNCKQDAAMANERRKVWLEAADMADEEGEEYHYARQYQKASAIRCFAARLRARAEEG